MGRATASLEPLRQPGFRLLWLSLLAWHCARWMDLLATGWLALELTGSAWHVALIGFYRNIPVPIFGVLAGAIADRIDRRLLVFLTGGINVAASLAVFTLYITGQLEYWQLAAANLLLGLSWALDWPSRRAMLPDLVSREQLMPAIVLDGMSMNLNRVLGPVLAGAIVAALSIPGCYLVVAIVHAIGLVPIMRIELPAVRKAHTAAGLRFIMEGLRFCRQYQAVWGVLVITIIMNCFIFPYIQLLPVFARDVLNVGPVGLGLLMASDGIGSIVSAVALVSSNRARRYGLMFVAGSALMCASILAFALSPLYAVSVALLVLGGIWHTGFSTFQSTIILQTVGDAMRGRAMGVLTLAIGSSPLGMLIMGGIAEGMSAPWAVGLSSMAALVTVLGTAAIAPGLLAQRAPEPGVLPGAAGLRASPLASGPSTQAKGRI